MKQIKGFSAYSITTSGKVWTNKYKKWLSPGKVNRGYLQVVLYKNNKRFQRKISRLMLETFVGPCPKNKECCHNNGVKDDNRLENLRWDTHSNNVKDAIYHGTHICIRRGEESSYHKLTERDVRMVIYMWRTKLFTQQEIAETYNVSQQGISNILNRKNWKHLWEK